MFIEKWFKQAHCVIYSTNIDSVLFYYLNSEKTRHYVLANLMWSIWVHLVIKKWFNQTLCVTYYTHIDSVLFHYFTIEKSVTMCQIIYCVKFGYIWSLKSGLITNTVIAIPRRLIQFCCTISPVKKPDTTC